MQFTKMEGVGNDFVVIDEADVAGLDLTELAERLCRRHFGIGADGLLVVGRRAAAYTVTDDDGARPSAEPLISMRMFNPDGTEDMCGNGLRCAAFWAFRVKDWTEGRREFGIATKDGVRGAAIWLTQPGDTIVSVDMGLPRLTAEAIPFCGAPGSTVMDFPLVVGGRTLDVTSVNTGSTHTVIIGDPPTEEEFQELSPLIENHPLYPERTSVLWTTQAATPDTFDIRIWERGAGETLGCGTGACAVAVAANLKGLLSVEGLGLDALGKSRQYGLERPIRASIPDVHIRSKGGTLSIRINPFAGGSVKLLGPANVVYEGNVEL